MIYNHYNQIVINVFKSCKKIIQNINSNYNKKINYLMNKYRNIKNQKKMLIKINN